MTKVIIIVIIAFLVLVYVYTYVKHKKRKGHVNTVAQFNQKYHKQNKTIQNASTNEEYLKYITKYNSSVDYIEREELINTVKKEKGLHNDIM